LYPLRQAKIGSMSTIVADSEVSDKVAEWLAWDKVSMSTTRT